MKKIYIILLIFIIFSCNFSNNNNTKQVDNQKVDKEGLLEWNKNIVDVNSDIIKKYIDRRQWKMNVSGSGLYWQIYKKTDLEKVGAEKFVEFSYTTALLSGEMLYSSQKSGNRILKIDKNQEESGLNEGLKYMRLGEKAHFIVPPHLAFGVAGDGYKIPPYAVLIFDVEIVGINDN